MERHDERTWFDPRTGDQVSLTYIGMVPDLPAPLDDLPRLRHLLAVETAETGSLIEAHVVQFDSVPAVYQLIKLPIPNRPTGLAFIAAFTLPRANCSAVLRIQCAEGDVSGIRESAIAAEVGFENLFPPHPYAPELQGQLPYNAADDMVWDQHFPDHPLSRARAWAHRMMATARVDPQFAALPPFQPAGPVAPPAAAGPVPPVSSVPSAEPEPVAPVTAEAPPEPVARPEPVAPERVARPEPVAPEPVAREPIAPPEPIAHQTPPEPVARQAPPPEPVAHRPTPEPVARQAPEPPVRSGDVLHTVLVGLPIGAYLPLWQESGVTFWRMTDPDAVRARLGAGVESRSELDNRRYREAAMLAPDRGTLFLMDRFRDETGNLGGTSTQLLPATEEEAYAAVDDKAVSELYAWLGEVVLGAVRRGEFVAVEAGGWHVPMTPVVLVMLRTDGREWHSVVETSPVPVGAPVWRDQQPVQGDTQVLASPATDQTIRASGLLTRFAVATWHLHPFQLGLSFGPNPTLEQR